MFGIQIKKSAPYNFHYLHDEKEQSAVELIPQRGGAINGIRLKGHDIIDGYRDGQEVQSNAWMKGMWLAPFPNRINRGSYNWNNQTYQLPINDTINQHAIHGFMMEETFPSLQFRKTPQHGIMTIQHQHNGQHTGYPFRFQFDLEVALSSNSARFEIAFTNLEDFAIPFGLGWHPYFTLGIPIDELTLTLPACKRVGNDKDMIPFGKNYPYDVFENGRKIGPEVLDDCFLIQKSSSIASFYLESQRVKLHFWQETGENGFNYFQVFTPHHRNSLAIEPMSCNIDAFNNEEGLLKALPNQTYYWRCGIELFD